MEHNYKFECYESVVYALKDKEGETYEVWTGFPDCGADPDLEVGEHFLWKWGKNDKGDKGDVIIAKKKTSIPMSILNVIGW